MYFFLDIFVCIIDAHSQRSFSSASILSFIYSFPALLFLHCRFPRCEYTAVGEDWVRIIFYTDVRSETVRWVHGISKWTKASSPKASGH